MLPYVHTYGLLTHSWCCGTYFISFCLLLELYKTYKNKLNQEQLSKICLLVAVCPSQCKYIQGHSMLCLTLGRQEENYSPIRMYFVVYLRDAAPGYANWAWFMQTSSWHAHQSCSSATAKQSSCCVWLIKALMTFKTLMKTPRRSLRLRSTKWRATIALKWGLFHPAQVWIKMKVVAVSRATFFTGGEGI